MSEQPFKKFLGDDVYADFDGFHVVLTVEDGRNINARICLEPEVLEAVNGYYMWVLATLYKDKFNGPTTNQETS
jgi:hypothetical protein